VCIDCGEFNEIHPKDKLPVANRLALQALYEVYHKIPKALANGPRYQSMIIRKSEIDLLFANAEGGFLVKTSDGEFENAEVVEGFEVAGEDRVFVSAKAYVHGSVISVSSNEVELPKYVRYCWTNYGPVSLYGKNKLPLAPFRTSPQDQKIDGDIESAKVQQIMEL
jgi:sialate O-acetylesterase